MVKIKRIYENPSLTDCVRMLVDRLWPRRMKREKVLIDLWLKDIALSHELRRWFDHNSDKW